MCSDWPTFPFRGVVVIADLVTEEPDIAFHLRRDLEQTHPEMLNKLSGAIKQLGLEFYHYENPKALAENAKQHQDDIVLSIYGGAVSRNRMALVPAVCESMGLRFIGPDAYGRIICQDKEVSKAIAIEAGLKVASHRIVRNHADLSRITEIQLPFVAKPLWEGSSIGIGPDSLISDYAQGISVISSMLEQFNQPIMIEAFIPGREVSYCFVQGHDECRISSLAELVWNNDPDYFDNHLYDANRKYLEDGIKTVHPINQELRHPDAAALERLLRFVGPLGYGRIDGKLRNGEFIFLEITPDAWLGSDGMFVNSFSAFGLSFRDIIARLLLSEH
jgi:D-alanine-D-alanine ligase